MPHGSELGREILDDKFLDDLRTEKPYLPQDKLVELAGKVGDLIRRYEARPRFQEMVRQWTADYEAQYAKQIAWRKRRDAHEKAIRATPKLRDKNAEPPGIRCKVKLALRRDDDGNEFNRVRDSVVIVPQARTSFRRVNQDAPYLLVRPLLES